MEDVTIKEWHFHVYWPIDCSEARAAAWTLREELIHAVASRTFVVICNGVSRDILSTLTEASEARVPRFNENPVGPHPVGSFEIWCPAEYLAPVLAWLMQRRRGLTMLLHPLGDDGRCTGGEVEDHSLHAMWLGEPLRLNLAVLKEQGGDGRQYPELGLGYSASGRK